MPLFVILHTFDQCHPGKKRTFYTNGELANALEGIEIAKIVRYFYRLPFENLLIHFGDTLNLFK